VAVALVIAIAGVFYLGIFPGRVLDAFSVKQSVSLTTR
jgi:hypothetical protein